MFLNTKKMVFGAVCIAFGLVLPVVFHLFGAAGAVFLPMHIPVLLAGFCLGRRGGVLVGVLTPFLSSMLTSMPPLFPVMPIMVVELSVYGLAAGYFYQSLKMNTYAALALTLTCGRIAAMLGAFLLMTVLKVKLSPLIYVTGALITGLPGIIIQFLVMPILVMSLEKIIKLRGRF